MWSRITAPTMAPRGTSRFAGGDGLTDLSSSPSGTEHTFIWASNTDLPNTSTSVLFSLVLSNRQAIRAATAWADRAVHSQVIIRPHPLCKLRSFHPRASRPVIYRLLGRSRVHWVGHLANQTKQRLQ